MARFRSIGLRGGVLLAAAVLAFALGGCEKLIGIEDTEVAGNATDLAGSPGAAGLAGSTSGATNAGSVGVGGASAGSAGAGTAHAGNASAGAAMGGSDSGGSAGANGGSAGAHAGSANAGSGGAQAGSAGSAGTAGASECPCAAPKPTCENNKCVVRGPDMAKVNDFYIDSTEVTAGQYKAFVTAKGSDVSGQRADCTWNTTYTPTMPADEDALPVAYVDFCDAVAFCAWADKRLCGAIGGGSLAPADVDDHAKDQWYRACTGVNETLYPYGNTYVKDNCNESNSVAVPKSYPKCEGGYSGIWDMTGNVMEWVDSCSGPADASGMCEQNGGSAIKPMQRCEYSYTDRRDAAYYTLGFRCCSK